jgi:hypothetical protein
MEKSSSAALKAKKRRLLMLDNPNALTEFLDKPNGQRLTHQQMREYLLAGINSPSVGAADASFVESLRVKHKISSEEKKD